MTETTSPPAPYRIRTDRQLIRCYEPSDAEALQTVAAESREHLVEWMPWALDDPQTVDEKLELLRRFRGQFDLGQDFIYGTFDPDSGALIGGTGLHPRVGPGGLEIGYWLHPDRCGQGLATESTSALVRVAIEHMRVNRIELHCAPSNAASRRVPEKLGFTQEGTLRQRFPWGDGTYRDTVVYALLAADYPESPCAGARIEMFDAAGRPLPLRSPG